MARSLRSRLPLATAAAALALLGSGTLAPAAASDADNTSRSAGKLAAPAAAPTTGFFAVVDLNGVLVRGKGAVSAQRLSEGNYEVIFNASIASCAFTGSVGNSGFSGFARGQISVQGRSGTNNGLFVSTSSSSGIVANRPFHVLVTC
jgi:hypothetical protein